MFNIYLVSCNENKKLKMYNDDGFHLIRVPEDCGGGGAHIKEGQGGVGGVPGGLVRGEPEWKRVRWRVGRWREDTCTSPGGREGGGRGRG